MGHLEIPGNDLELGLDWILIRLPSASPQTIAVGVLANILLALESIWYTLRRQSRTQASFRLQQGSEETVLGRERKRGLSLIAGYCGIVFGGVTLILSLLQMLPIQVGYFLAGVLVARWWYRDLASRIGRDRNSKGPVIDARRVGRLNNGRRPIRNLTVVGTLAGFSGGIGSRFSKEKDTSGNDPKNGYGGFAFWAETSIPLSDPADYSGPDNLFDVASDEAIAPFVLGTMPAVSISIKQPTHACWVCRQTTSRNGALLPFIPFVKVWMTVRVGIF